MDRFWAVAADITYCQTASQLTISSALLDGSGRIGCEVLRADRLGFSEARTDRIR